MSVLAAAFVGLLRGHKKLSLENREARLDAFLANRLATQISALEHDALKPVAAGGEIVVEQVASPSGADNRVVCRLADQILLEKSVPMPGLAQRLLELPLESAHARAIALDLCRALGWIECVRSRVDAPTCELASDPKGKIIGFRFPGFVEVEHELDVEKFRGALRSATPLPSELEVTYLARLDA